jgi:regulator of sirC expression with transglutaminase-like and TPR domain
VTSPAAVVAEVLAVPDDKLDYLSAKLTFDRIIDSSIDSQVVAAEIDQLVATTSNVAGPTADEHRKLAALRRVIYDAGAWNNNRPYAYDMSDPLGTKISTKLLSNYLRSRRGNCISMPILFLIVADRLGIAGTALATAPAHDFVRYTDVSGRTFNIETTSGGHVARDEWIRHLDPMSDAAVASGIYLRSLTRREAVAEMAMEVVEHLGEQRRYQDVIEVSDLILRNYPHDVDAMVWKGSAYSHLIQIEFMQNYPTPNLIPRVLRSRYFELNSQSQAAFDAAGALGWQPPQAGAPSQADIVEAARSAEPH